MMVTQNLSDNSSSAEKICSQLEILLAQQQRLQNDVCQVKLIQSGMNAMLASVQNILMSTNQRSPDVTPSVDDTAATNISISAQRSEEPEIDNGRTTRSRITSFEPSTRSHAGGSAQTPASSVATVSNSLWGGRRSVDYLKKFRLTPREEYGYWVRHEHLTDIWQSQSMRLTRICESRAFQACIVIIILANTVLMACEADLMMSNALQAKEDSENTFEVANGVFCVLFSMELSLRLAAYRCRFFCDKGWTWNVFDLILVATAVNDQIQTVFHVKTRNQNLVFLRIVQACRMVKKFRLFRLLRFWREMRLLVENIAGSMKSLLWASILIAMVNFVLGLVFLQASSKFLFSDSAVDAQVQDSLSSLYGSTPRAMLTLYMSTTGGMDWKEAAAPLRSVGLLFYFLFILYISFSMFVVSNVVTSMFVDTALQASSKDAQYLVAEHLRKKQKHLKKIQSIFEGMEKNPDGSVSVEAFAHHLHDTAMVAFCEEIEVEPADLEQFFMALSGDGKRSVDLDTFVVGCIKLRGNAKSSDVMEVLMEINKANHGIHSLLKRSRDSPIKEMSMDSNRVHL